MDTCLFVSTIVTEDELLHLWKAEAGAPPVDGGLAAGERAPPVGSAEAGAAALAGLDDGERAPPVGSA